MEARLPNPFPDLEPHIPHCQASCTRYNNLSFLVSFQEIHIRNLKRIRMDINIYIYIFLGMKTSQGITSQIEYI